jgi:predicted Zn-dependent protease with MMP-like domain
MISLVEMEGMLNEIVDEFPQELFKELNGGIILLPEAKLHPITGKNDLYILGEYHKNGNMGRYITIYYGSFLRVYGYLGKKDLREKLVHTLKHEFIHHLESLAGERGLEIKDAQYLVNYLKRKES